MCGRARRGVGGTLLVELPMRALSDHVDQFRILDHGLTVRRPVRDGTYRGRPRGHKTSSVRPMAWLRFESSFCFQLTFPLRTLGKDWSLWASFTCVPRPEDRRIGRHDSWAQLSGRLAA